MYKEDGVHIHDGILLSHEKEWNNVICSNMDNLEIILSDISQRYTNAYDVTYFVASKIWHNWIEDTETNTENRLMIAKGEGSWGMNGVGGRG